MSLILLSVFSLTPVQAKRIEDVFDEFDYRAPVIENVELNVDGSITPQLINITKDFDYVARLIVHLHWLANFIFFDDFGSGSALANGSLVLYDGVAFNSAVKSHEDFGKLSYDIVILTDERSPKSNRLLARLSFTRFIDNNLGLKIKDGHMLSFLIRDNITDQADEFSVLVEGWKLVKRELGIRYSFIEEVYFLDDLIDIPFAIILLPIALILSGDEMISLIGLAVGLAYGLMILELFMRIIRKRRS